MNIGVYAAAAQVKEWIRISEENIKDDKPLKRFCIEASRVLNQLCSLKDNSRRRWFYPIRAIKYFDHPGESGGFYSGQIFGTPPPNIQAGHTTGANTLQLNEDLLQVVSLTTNNGGLAIVSSDYILSRGGNPNISPFDAISLKQNASQRDFRYTGSPLSANALDGYWGWHDDYSSAWVQVDQLAGDIAQTATVAPVGDADGPDEMGIEPRFMEQMLCRFGSDEDAEMFFISLINYDGDDQLTIIRGVNGTTAQAQTDETPIFVYRPPEIVVRAVRALAIHSYRRPAAFGKERDRPVAAATGVVILPDKLPSEINDLIANCGLKSKTQMQYGNQGDTPTYPGVVYP